MTVAAIAAADDESAAAPEVQTVEFKGETFEPNPDISEFAVVEFAEAVDAGLDGSSFAGLAATLRLAIEAIAEKDRARFRAVARREKATFDDLFEFLVGKTEADAERPTGPSADSSGGRENTQEKSAASSVGKGSPLAGRPDLMIAVEDAVRAA